jgi:hypothetical protein
LPGAQVPLPSQWPAVWSVVTLTQLALEQVVLAGVLLTPHVPAVQVRV